MGFRSGFLEITETSVRKRLRLDSVIIESDARPTGVQLKREAMLLTLTGLNTKHADCRIILYKSAASTTDLSKNVTV